MEEDTGGCPLTEADERVGVRRTRLGKTYCTHNDWGKGFSGKEKGLVFFTGENENICSKFFVTKESYRV